jgi:hypothetical protein
MTEDDRLASARIKDLLGDDYFRLALEKQVRDRIDGYLKRLGAFALILLAVAGYGSWNLVEEAKKKFEESEKTLTISVSELKREQEKLQEEGIKLQERSIEVQGVLLAAQKDASSVKEDVQSVQHIKDAAQSANTAAEDAIRRAEIASAAATRANSQVQSTLKDIEAAKAGAVDARSRADASASIVGDTATQIHSLLPAQTQLMMAKESTELLVRGKKAPCVDLSNWVEPDGDGFKLLPVDRPQSFHVRFRVRHIHLRPVNLQMEVLKKSCNTYESGEAFVYDKLPKNDSVNPHPIPGTPFAFRLTFVYDPLLTYDFVVLKLSPETDLLKGSPNYSSSALYDDRTRAAVYRP